MALEITLREQTSIPIEVDTIRLETVREQTPDQIKSTTVFYGNRQPTLGDFFDVQGSADDGQIVWIGDCSKVKLIGTHLTSGHVRVEGDAGMHLGAEMTGGEIEVRGNAADWVGAEMHGGTIRIRGNAGHLVGGVYRGGRRGMTGGQIYIHGNAGNEIGHTMRRGLIAVAGNVGDAVGFNMIAGSVFVFGTSGIRHGAGMRRGTIGLFGEPSRPDLLPTFRYSGRQDLLYLKLFFRELAARDFPMPKEFDSREFDRYRGDFLELGYGEVLTRAFPD